MKTSLRFFILFSLLLLFSQGIAQQSQRLRRILENLQRYELDYPQQKVFLHLDRQEYVAGENIWFKAYLVQANNLIPDTSSTSLNVELFRVSGEAVALQLVRMQDGLGYGQIHLSDSLPEGNYKLRSYTNWMLNFSEALFFEQDIFIHNPIEQNFIRRANIRANASFNKELEMKKTDVQWGCFPEGGQLVAGVENRVAFFVADATGEPLEAGGKVLDEAGQTLASIQTRASGMGMFTLTPAPGQSCRVELEVQGRGVKTFPLPAATEQAYSLRVDTGAEIVQVKVMAGFNPIALNLPDEVILVVQSRGKALFIEEGKLMGRQFTTSFPLELLPSGVSQVTLFDALSTPLAERLIFVDHKDHIHPALDLQKTRVGSENGLQLGFHLDFVEGSGEWAHLSLAVEGSQQPFETPAPNILAELLLRNDLAASLPGIQSYFPGNEGSAEVLDLIMMTHGWRRFDWKDILTGAFPQPRYIKASGQVLSGQLSTTNTDQVPSNVLLEITIAQQSREVYTTTTDQKGLFSLAGLDYNGPFTAEFRMPEESRPRGFRLRLDGSELTPISFSVNAFTKPVSALQRGDNWKRVSSPSVFAVASKASEVVQRSESIYGTPDQTIYMDDISVNYSNVLEVFRGKATGVSFAGNQIRIRGEGSINSSNEPLFMLDGVVVPQEVLLNLRPTELDRIEILKGPSTAIFGSRGANGVIVAYSKRGATTGPLFQYSLLGFATPREFFNSRIHLDYKKKNRIKHTIFWEPGIMPDELGRFGMGFPLREQWKYSRVILQGIHSSGKLIWTEVNLD